MLLLFLACQDPKTETKDTGEPVEPSTEVIDTAEPSETGETDETGDTSEDTETGETDTEEDTSTPVTEGPVFSFVRKEHVGGTNIWSNLVTVGDDFLFSTMQGDRVAFRRYAQDLEILSEYTYISEVDDLPAGVELADHKVILIDDALFFAVSGFGDRDLILIKTDLDGNRLGFYNVQENVFDNPTNDMHLFEVNGEPCLRWGDSGIYKSFQCFSSADLSPHFDAAEREFPEPIPQLGATLQVGNSLISFTGDGAQRNLIVSHYNIDYTAADPFTEVILATNNDDWHWFSSGVAFHPQYRLWFVAYTTMPSDGSADFHSVVELAAFTEDFQLIDHQILSGPSFTRPNVTLIGDSLIVGYDNHTEVFLEHWDIIPSVD